MRQLREQRGLSQRQVADAIGVTYQQVQKYEDGTNTITTIRVADLCKVLQVSAAALFDNLTVIE
jgi:transcriptional regulator with XRE-family HTH domain